MHCGIKKNGAPDLAMIFSEKPAHVAGVLTRNLFKSAAVQYTRRVLDGGILRAVVINSGNANAATGEQGRRDAEAMARTTAECLGVAPEQVAVASTGVIGVLMPIDRIEKGIRKLSGSLHSAGGDAAAQAIMTTDTFAKSVAIKAPLSSGEITIAGMTKGAGMIAPDMATMLAFVTTDAAIEASLLLKMLREIADATFNSVTVDGDNSTNDTLLAIANGASGTPSIVEGSEDFRIFQAALEHVCAELSRMIARDGEGATKLVEIHVRGAKQKADASKMGKTIANSLLVKTAIFGCDANWGRIMAAAGRSGVALVPEKMEIRLGDLSLFKDGSPIPFDEEQAKRILSQKDVRITVDLHVGVESATVLTCDLSYDYVKINASYRT
jgi:glutamate N-acetyltransferase/amino-acid N-acetyltransferase